jgi:hypothetical protein
MEVSKTWKLLLSGAWFALASLNLPASEQAITLPPDVGVLVAPVINAAAAVAAKEDETTDSALDDRLDKVLNPRTAKTTEALAVLLGFYVGEAAAEDISCELVAPGKRALPMLHRYMNSIVVVPGFNMSHARRITTEYEIVVRRINSGERCEREE